MPFWSDDFRGAFASAGVLRAVALVEFDFADASDADKRYWAGGFGPLVTADARVWQGGGEVAKISGLSSVIGTDAPQVTFVMSGVSSRIVALAQAQSSKIKGRAWTVYIQAFGNTFADLLDFITLESGEMDRMHYKCDAPNSYTVTLTGESLWTARSRPPRGEYSDTDQQSRFPGDFGLEFAAALATKQVYYGP